jgi:hypothetical protein
MRVVRALGVDIPPRLGRATRDVDAPSAVLAFGVVVLALVLAPSLIGVGVVVVRSFSCLAVIPIYLLARDPAVIFGAALFAVLFPSVRRPAVSGVSSSLGARATDRVPKLGVVAPRRTRSAAGVTRPETEDARER